MSSKASTKIPKDVDLISLDDAQTWEQVEDVCREVVRNIPNLEEFECSLEDLRYTKDFFTKEELDKVVLWKHTVGKNRIYNVKYLDANSEESVQNHSRAAISLAHKIKVEECLEEDGSLSQVGRKGIQEAMGELGKLKGVGPATASAVLTLIRPDLFCYLYDEVIDCFEPQRDYKISNYLRVNSRCLQIARKLGGTWTSNRVAKTIWTAARFLENNGEGFDPSTSEDRHPLKKSNRKIATEASTKSNKYSNENYFVQQPDRVQRRSSPFEEDEDEEGEDEDDDHSEGDDEDLKHSDTKRQRT